MKKKHLYLLVLLGIYHVLFWGEDFGINLGIFHLVWLGVWVRFYPSSFLFGFTRMGLLGTTVAAVFGVLHHSTISYIAYFASFAVTTVYLHAPILKSLTYGLRYAVHDYWQALKLVFTWNRISGHSLRQELLHKGEKGYKSLVYKVWGTKSWQRVLHVSIFPLLFFGIFLFLYRIANPDFAYLIDHAWLKLQDSLYNFFTYISIEYIVFISAGFIWIGLSLYHRYHAAFSIREALCSELLLRSRKDYKGSGILLPMNELTQEYRTAILTFGLLNILLCLVNLTDVGYIWISFDPRQVNDLTGMVHRGTYVLIFSILLSMFLVLYWFRANLNFYPRGKILRRLALVWIYQNAFLALSVGLRTYYYIAEQGMAYKRLGVLLFLVLTLFGLFSLIVKVRDRKSLYFVWKYNSWAAYIMLIAMSTIDWDMMIVRYNLDHVTRKGRVADGFTMSRAPKTLRLVYPYLKNQDPEKLGTISSSDFVYDTRIPEFIEKFEKKSWKSWNYSEYVTYMYLKEVLQDDLSLANSETNTH